MSYGQIPLDGPDRTGPDPTRQVRVSCLRQSLRLCLLRAKFHYTGPTRLCRRLS